MMRTVLPLLAIAAGCNWAFRLQETSTHDASGPGLDSPDLPNFRASLVWAIPNGAGAPTFAAIGSESLYPQTPTVLVGPATGAMEKVVYHVGAVDGEVGTFEIPYTLRDVPYRIAFTLPGRTDTHEFQLTGVGAKLAISRSTRMDAAAAPGGAGITMHPVGAPNPNPSNMLYPMLYSTGVYTYVDRPEHFTHSNGRFTVANWRDVAYPYTGPSGALVPAEGDRVVYGHMQAEQGPYRSRMTGYAIAPIAVETSGLHGPATEPAWVTSPLRTMSNQNPSDPFPSFPVSGAVSRMENVLGSVGLITSPVFSYLLYGVSPGTSVHPLIEGPFGGRRALMLGFYEAGIIGFNISLVDPSPELGLERVIFTQLAGFRQPGPYGFTSSLMLITKDFVSSPRWAATLATSIKLGSTDLIAQDEVQHPLSNQPTKLTWAREASFSADNYVVSLYEVQLASGTLTPLRHYHVTSESVDIDSSLLAVGKIYVFSIRSEVGHPGAKQNDYRTVTFPFSAATTFGRAFKIIDPDT
jgi:hypothetical protein